MRSPESLLNSAKLWIYIFRKTIYIPIPHYVPVCIVLLLSNWKRKEKIEELTKNVVKVFGKLDPFVFRMLGLLVSPAKVTKMECWECLNKHTFYFVFFFSTQLSFAFYYFCIVLFALHLQQIILICRRMRRTVQFSPNVRRKFMNRVCTFLFISFLAALSSIRRTSSLLFIQKKISAAVYGNPFQVHKLPCVSWIYFRHNNCIVYNLVFLFFVFFCFFMLWVRNWQRPPIRTNRLNRNKRITKNTGLMEFYAT